ncbi:MAG: hypothetical protein HY315_05520 [Acidobacteria bacterium]|nr:hypothetical protein [Acidobacteriota bacterium]
MQSYYVTFYLQYAAQSEEEATARAERILRLLGETEKPDEAVIVAIGLAPQLES